MKLRFDSTVHTPARVITCHDLPTAAFEPV
jgi:hypothetical protein